jgi:hypothetical protein
MGLSPTLEFQYRDGLQLHVSILVDAYELEWIRPSNRYLNDDFLRVGEHVELLRQSQGPRVGRYSLMAASRR